MRHENIVNLEHNCPSWMSADHYADIRQASARIFRRVGSRIYADVPRRELCFGYEDSDGWLHIQWWFGAFDVHTKQPKKIEGASEDAVVNAIFKQLNVPRKVKMQWMKDIEAEEKKAREQRQGEKFEAVRPEAEAVVGHMRKRDGMSSKYRPAAVVNGLKGV